jgi:hypothetical protein
MLPDESIRTACRYGHVHVHEPCSDSWDRCWLLYTHATAASKFMR